MILASAGQAWPPFVLVAGLLLIGAATAADGVFEALGARLARTRLPARGLLLALLGLVAVVTAASEAIHERAPPSRSECCRRGLPPARSPPRSSRSPSASAATALRRLPPRLDLRALLLLFALAVALGTIGRLWQAPAQLLDSSGIWTAAAIGAAASVLVNNLPATVLFTAHPAAHPEALLLGLDLGPNLAVTGSLSAVLWLQAARAVGARPSIATYSRLRFLLVPLTIAAALTALASAS
jgi:Na+/H+ antiporter NhaD/arsenite permease-like protein